MPTPFESQVQAMADQIQISPSFVKRILVNHLPMTTEKAELLRFITNAPAESWLSLAESFSENP